MNKRCMGCMEEYNNEYDLCPCCGYVDGTEAEEAIHITPGTFLGERYVIGKVLGFGGFGVTYIGWDTKLEQKVAIKEYLPSEFSTRMPGQLSVTIFNGEKQEQFQDGLNKFVEEAKRLSKFQNEPGVVKVFDSFVENCTAYIIMEYLDGETLTSRIEREGAIPEDEAVSMLLPVMNSLQTVHQEGILHRDIAPDNIFLTKDGEVKLIDFGASRYATTSHSRSLTVIIKPGYSPEEQYRSRGDQGPHTDVYAMAATLYKTITGVTPPDALERRASIETKRRDLIVNPRKCNRKLSPIYENALLNAMNVQIEDRTPDMTSFMEELSADSPVKRRYGKIRKTDFFTWPLWLKILIPLLLAAFLTFGALLATGVIDFPSLFSDEVVVPDGTVIVPNVEGMDKDAAIKLLEENNLTPLPDGNISSEYVDAGKIILQSPSEGAYIEEQGIISLTVSSGAGIVEAENGISTVPYVIWDNQEDAIAKLKQAGLAEPLIETRSDDNVPSGSVIEQSIEAGTEVDEGTQMTLVISTGPAAFEMPNVVGKSASSAESTLKGKGLIVTVQYEKNNDIAEGTVLSQSIKEGTSVKKGDTITITVSSGKKTVSVANVVGKTKTTAVSTLEDQKLLVSVVENYSDTVASGNVISQSPAAGTTQVVGTTITIYVSKGKQPITVPNVVGRTSSAASSTLTQSGFVVSVVEQYSSSVASGNVISQSPNSGTTKYAGDTVTIYVSKGPETISVTEVEITDGSTRSSNHSESRIVGYTVQLTAKVYPSNATNTNVKWSSSNTSVATVSSSGYVQLLKEGQATITLTSVDGSKTAKWIFYVESNKKEEAWTESGYAYRKTTYYNADGTVNKYILEQSTSDQKFLYKYSVYKDGVITSQQIYTYQNNWISRCDVYSYGTLTEYYIYSGYNWTSYNASGTVTGSGSMEQRFFYWDY